MNRKRKSQNRREEQLLNDIQRVYGNEYLKTLVGSYFEQNIKAVDLTSPSNVVPTIVPIFGLILSGLFGSWVVGGFSLQLPNFNTDDPDVFFSQLMHTDFGPKIITGLLAAMLTILVVAGTLKIMEPLIVTFRRKGIFYILMCALVLLMFPELVIRSGQWQGKILWIVQGSAAGCFMAAFVIASALLSGLLLGYYRYLRILFSIRLAPDLFFAVSLFRALALLTKQSRIPHLPIGSDSDDVQSIPFYLERAALSLEVFAYSYHPSANIEEWCVEAYKRRAMAIRSLQKWFILPKADTKLRLENRLRELLEIVANGNWDGLPEEEYKLPPLSFKTRIFQFVQACARILIPCLTALSFKHFAVLPTGAIETYVIASLWVMAGLNLILLLDPRIGDKVTSLKDLSSFSFLGKSKEP